MQGMAIQTRGLTRYFEDKPIVRDLDMGVRVGSITGLLGLNGAGKTTTLRMILGLLSPTRGTSEVLGVPSQALTAEDRSRIGHTVEGHFLYPWMKVRQCEAFHRETHTHWDSKLFENTVRRFGIDFATPCGRLSRGQRAGVSLALMLGSLPELLILDDPALGLDPVSRRALNETILEVASEGTKTVLLSSHLLDDVERVADQVLIMIDGQLVVNTTIEDLRTRVSGWELRFASLPRKSLSVPGLIHSRRVGDRWLLVIADADQESMAAMERLQATHIEQIAVPFDETVMAYLSRSRRGESFLVNTEN